MSSEESTEAIMASGTIALREPRDIVDGWISGYEQSFALAEQLCVTDFVPKELRDKPGATLACILTGRELGIGPMSSLRFVQMVEGSASLSAEYKRAAVLSAGHEFEILDWTSTSCKVRGRRRGTAKWTNAGYSMDDARRANLIKPRGAYLTRPRRMLLARASSDLCDAIFPDVTNGLPTTELVQEGLYQDGQLIEELADDTTATPAGGAQDESDKPVRRARAPRGTGTRGSRAKKPVAAPPEDDAEEEIFDAEVVEDEPGEDGSAADEQETAADVPDDQEQAEAEDPFADGDEPVSGNAPAEAADLRKLGILFREAGLRSATEKVDLAKQVLGHAPGAEMTAMDAHELIKILQLAIKKDNPKAALKKLAETAERDRLGEDGD